MGGLIPSEDDRLIARIRSLEEELQGLKTRSSTVPIFAADPDIDLGVRLWLLNDGRLRGYKANGSIVEWSWSNHKHDDRYALLSTPGPGGGTGGTGSTEPPKPPPYVPKTRVYESNADWTQSYQRGGAEVYSTGAVDLYYGQYQSGRGILVSMAHFPGVQAALAPGPKGTRIAEVWLRLSNVHTYLNSGTDLRIATHNADGKPGQASEVSEIGRIRVGKPSHNVWYRLPAWVGNRFRDGSAKGITFNQGSSARALYGYAAGVGSPRGNPPRLKIVYVK